MAAPGLALENWSGSEDAAGALARTADRARRTPGAGRDRRRSACPTAIAAPRGARCCSTCATSARSACSTIRFPGLLWSDAIYGHATLSRDGDRGDPGDVRRRAGARRAGRANRRAGASRRTRRRRATRTRIARGRSIFAERIVGTIANRQIFKRAPRAYAAAKIDGPVLAPIDATQPLDAKLAVRCADCHSAAPLEHTRPLAENPPPLGRCTHCHVSHVRVEEWRDAKAAPHPTLSPPSGERDELIAIAALASRFGRDRRRRWRSAPGATRSTATSDRWSTRRAGCSRSTPTATATRRAIPAADRRAGGIGTEPLLAFDVPITQRPFSVDVAVDPRSGARRPRRPRPHRRQLGARRAARRPARERALPAQRLGADAARAARAGRAPPGHASRSAPPASCSTRASPATATRATSSAPRSAPPRSRTWSRFLETL